MPFQPFLRTDNSLKNIGESILRYWQIRYNRLFIKALFEKQSDQLSLSPLIHFLRTYGIRNKVVKLPAYDLLLGADIPFLIHFKEDREIVKLVTGITPEFMSV